MECEEQRRLLDAKDAAFSEWYEARSALEQAIALRRGDVAAYRKAAGAAEKKVHHCQRAIEVHYGKHRCNTSDAVTE